MEVSVHLHRGDGHVAAVKKVGTSQWFSIIGKDDAYDVTLFIPSELASDAEAFAESINTYCQKRVGLAG